MNNVHVNNIWAEGMGGWQINGVCVSPTGKQSGSPVRRPLPEPVRRSKSQGTSRKLQKCLSTVSYSDDGLLPPPRISHQDRANLLVSRQYCSFGSTVTSFGHLECSLVFECYLYELYPRRFWFSLVLNMTLANFRVHLPFLSIFS